MFGVDTRKNPDKIVTEKKFLFLGIHMTEGIVQYTILDLYISETDLILLEDNNRKLYKSKN